MPSLTSGVEEPRQAGRDPSVLRTNLQAFSWNLQPPKQKVVCVHGDDSEKHSTHQLAPFVSHSSAWA